MPIWYAYTYRLNWLSVLSVNIVNMFYSFETGFVKGKSSLQWHKTINDINNYQIT